MTPETRKVTPTRVTKTESRSSTKSKAKTEAEDVTYRRKTIEDTLPVLGDSSGKNMLPEKSSAEE